MTRRAGAASPPATGARDGGETALAAAHGGPQRRRVPLPLRLTFWLSVAAAAFAGVVHVLSFAGRAYFSVLGLVPLLFVVWPLVLWQWRRVPRRNLSSEIFGDIPRWMKAAIGAALLYAFVIFFACRALTGGGSPERRSDGTHALVFAKGDVRPISLAEFRAAQAVQVRLLSGELLVFFVLAALLAEACWIKNGTAMADRSVD